MNRENPILRPYENLERLEDLMDRLTVDLQTYTGKSQCRPDETVIVSAVELRQVGLKVQSQWDDGEVSDALTLLSISDEDIEVVVIADAKFLRRRSIVKRCTLAELSKGLSLFDLGQVRPPTLLDKRHGYAISVNAVLSRELEKAPLKPWREGTILAESLFTVSPTSDLEGLDPEPLTDDIIREHQLPRSAHTFVLLEADDLLGLESLTGNIRVFVNEDLYERCSSKRNQMTVQHMRGVAINALIQICYMVSDELADIDDVDELESDRPVIVRLIENALEEVVGKTHQMLESLVHVLRSDPNRVASALSGADDYSKNWRPLLDPAATENDEEQ